MTPKADLIFTPIGIRIDCVRVRVRVRGHGCGRGYVDGYSGGYSYGQTYDLSPESYRRSNWQVPPLDRGQFRLGAIIKKLGGRAGGVTVRDCRYGWG